MEVSTAIKQLNEQEQSLLRELQKCRDTRDSLLALVKREKKATKHVDAARERAAGGGKKKRGSDAAAAIGQLLVDQAAPMTLDEIAEKTTSDQKYPKRIAGVVLASMARRDLVRKRSDGSFVAKAKLVHLIESTANGSTAEA